MGARSERDITRVSGTLSPSSILGGRTKFRLPHTKTQTNIIPRCRGFRREKTTVLQHRLAESPPAGESNQGQHAGTACGAGIGEDHFTSIVGHEAPAVGFT